MNMTFKINGEDFTDVIAGGGYTTDRKPVVAASVTTMDGVTHQVVSRYKGSVTVTLRPVALARAQQLCTALTSDPISVDYYSLQRGAAVTENMTLSSMSQTLVRTSAVRDAWLKGEALTLEQL